MQWRWSSDNSKQNSVTPGRSPFDGWRFATTKTAALLEEKDVRIVGVTSDRAGAGVSSFAHALAETFCDYGRKVLLVDGSAVADADAASDHGDDTLQTDLSAVVLLKNGIFVADLDEVCPPACRRDGGLAAFYVMALEQFDRIIVDLPPVVAAGHAGAGNIVQTASGCEALLLVCLAGETRRRELTDCLQSCSLLGLNISGIVLNDRKLRFGSMLGTV